MKLKYILVLFLGILYGTSYADQFRQEQLNTSLFYASKAGPAYTVEELIEKGADVNSVQIDNETPLHAAAATGKINVIKVLKARGATSNPRTSSGWVPLHHAVRFGHEQVVSYLLSTGTSLYIQTFSHRTVFDLAEATKNQRMINVLEYWRNQGIH